jgi:hypothetical protein
MNSLVVVMALVGIAAEETIPLDRIWALGMPGTKDLRSLNEKSKENPLLTGIEMALRVVPPVGKKAKPVFVVSGTGAEALKEAHGVIVDDKPTAQTFPIGSNVSIVFFRIALTITCVSKM